MEFELPELHRYGGASSFYSSSSSVARYLSDVGFSRRGDPLLAPSHREDIELENHCRRLREIADRVELAHIRMLDEHNRWARAIAERASYTFHIPFYPELPLENVQTNHTVQMAPFSRTRMVIPGGHKRAAQPTGEFSIEAKRYKQNFQTQAVPCRPEHAKPPARLHQCFICNISCTSENDLTSHYNGKKHRGALNGGCEEFEQTLCGAGAAGVVGSRGISEGFARAVKSVHGWETAQPTAEFSNKNNYVLVNGATKPVLVMQDGQWFCNLCETKQMSENVKENHIKSKRHEHNLQAQAVLCSPEPGKPVLVMQDGQWFCNLCETKQMSENDKENHIKSKRHKQNLQAQAVSCKPEPAKPILVKTDDKWFCNLCQTKEMSETIKGEHIKGKKHKQNLQAQSVNCRPEPAKPPARLHRCFICNIVYTTEDKLIVHFNGKTHREALTRAIEH